jgi:hypothetical protein
MIGLRFSIESETSRLGSNVHSVGLGLSWCGGYEEGRDEGGLPQIGSELAPNTNEPLSVLGLDWTGN